MPARSGAHRSAHTATHCNIRHYIPELLPDVLDGRLRPGRVFDLTVPLDQAADGYQAMYERTAVKVLLQP